MLLVWRVSVYSLSSELRAEGRGRAAWSPRPKAPRRRGPKVSGPSPASASLMTEAPSGCLLCRAWPWWHYPVSILGASGRMACSVSVCSVSRLSVRLASRRGQGGASLWASERPQFLQAAGVVVGLLMTRGLRLPVGHGASAWTGCLFSLRPSSRPACRLPRRCVLLDLLRL